MDSEEYLKMEERRRERVFFLFFYFFYIKSNLLFVVCGMSKAQKLKVIVDAFSCVLTRAYMGMKKCTQKSPFISSVTGSMSMS